MITKNMVAVSCSGHRSFKLKNKLITAALFFLDDLKITNTQVATEIRIILTDLDADGYCDFNYDHKYPEVTIFLDKSEEVNAQLLTLAHECVHVKQFLNKELVLKGDKSFWKKREVDVKEIINSPWEEEAYNKESILLKRFQHGQF